MNDPEIRVALEKGQKDKDRIVSSLSTRALALQSPTPHRAAKLFVSAKNAREPGLPQAPTLNEFLPSCNQVDQFTDDTSVSCMTTKHVIFRRVKNPAMNELGWSDTETKHVWYDFMREGVSQFDAESFCSDKPGETLPSRDDFYIAEQHGLREILKNMKSYWFWTSSGSPNNTDFAYDFNGGGSVAAYNHRTSNGDGVVCVSDR